MSKPHIICHMASSLDGRTLPSRWTPSKAHSPDSYDALHERLGGGSWLVGRTTGQEFAKTDAYPADTAERFPREPWLPVRNAAAFAFVIDAHGEIAWGRADIGGDPIVVILSEGVSDAHLAGLRSDGVGYLFAGRGEVDIRAAMTLLASELHVTHLLLEGGGTINGAFLRTGLVDEISLMLVPAIDGKSGAPATFDGPDGTVEGLPIERLTLKSHELLDGGMLWLRYEVQATR